MAKITIRQVAREAGVSPATASRALSAKQFNGPISDGTREKVIAAAARLHYPPVARTSLRCLNASAPSA